MEMTTSETHQRPRRRWWVSLALVMATVLGSAGVVWAGSQTPGGLVARPHSHARHVALTVKVVGGPLVPGLKRTMKVRVSNPFPYPVYVHTLKVKPRTTTVVGCQRSWFKTSKFKSNRRHPSVQVKAHRRATMKLTIVLKNLPTVNQDACKTAKVRLALQATASKRR